MLSRKNAAKRPRDASSRTVAGVAMPAHDHGTRVGQQQEDAPGGDRGPRACRAAATAHRPPRPPGDQLRAVTPAGRRAGTGERLRGRSRARTRRGPARGATAPRRRPSSSSGVHGPRDARHLVLPGGDERGPAQRRERAAGEQPREQRHGGRRQHGPQQRPGRLNAVWAARAATSSADGSLNHAA